MPLPPRLTGFGQVNSRVIGQSPFSFRTDGIVGRRQDQPEIRVDARSMMAGNARYAVRTRIQPAEENVSGFRTIIPRLNCAAPSRRAWPHQAWFLESRPFDSSNN
jgi:hypothetical protein